MAKKEIEDIRLLFNFLEKQMKNCTENEIEELKQLGKGKPLPKNYIEFMKMAGNGVNFLKGSDYTVSYVYKLKEWAIELLKENDCSQNLTDNDFVFFMHQGYQFAFFKLDEGDDPPVYYYHEGDDFFTEYKSFSDFLIEQYNGFRMISV